MAEPAISAQFLRHVANCLELTGRSSDALLAAIDVTRPMLEDPERRIRLADFLSFFEAAAEYSNNPHFGLHVGRLAVSDSLGPLSFLFLSAPTLQEAFSSFTRYLATMQQASRNVFFEQGDIATFEYAVTDQSLNRRRQDAEYSIGATYTLARQFAGARFALQEVRFEHEMVGEYARYREYFGCDVFFEQDRNSFSFDSEMLATQGRALSSALHPILEDHLLRKSEEHTSNATLAGQVRAMIEGVPLDRKPSITEVAADLGLSVATLNRHLRAEGQLWKTIVRERRMQGAARLLRESRRDIADIALAIGFAESASFIRSFRSHFGITPNRYRRAAAPSGDKGITR